MGEGMRKMLMKTELPEVKKSLQLQVEKMMRKCPVNMSLYSIIVGAIQFIVILVVKICFGIDFQVIDRLACSTPKSKMGQNKLGSSSPIVRQCLVRAFVQTINITFGVASKINRDEISKYCFAVNQSALVRGYVLRMGSLPDISRLILVVNPMKVNNFAVLSKDTTVCRAADSMTDTFETFSNGPCQSLLEQYIKNKSLRTCADHPAHAQSVFRAFALHSYIL